MVPVHWQWRPRPQRQQAHQQGTSTACFVVAMTLLDVCSGHRQFLMQLAHHLALRVGSQNPLVILMKTLTLSLVLTVSLT